jgi:hypothetical protein
MEPLSKMALAGLIIAIIALIISIMPLPTVFQMFWGGPRIMANFSEIIQPDRKTLICQIVMLPISSVILRRLRVRREPAVISADFSIFEFGTNRLMVENARARLFDLGDEQSTGFRGTIVDHMPLCFICLARMSDGRTVTGGGLSGQQTVVLPVGHYVVLVRIACGQTYISHERHVMVGADAMHTSWFGS